MSGADLNHANLVEASLVEVILDAADLRGATFGRTRFYAVDLSRTINLSSAFFEARCVVGTDTLVCSRGRIPETFLRGCGLAPWEVLASKLYDPALTPAEIVEIQYKIFDERTKGVFIGGVFISYSHSNASPVDRLYDRLYKEGVNVWLDRHDMVAGSIETQVQKAIRLNDVVVLVLSEASLASDWVEAELEWARRKEKDENRDVLCPIALDDAWKAKVQDSVLWRQVQKKNVLDFSHWRDEARFAEQFQKLLKGLKLCYGPAA